MKINRPMAVMIALVLILGGSFAKAKITFSSYQKQLNTQFIEGTERDGYSIASDIEGKINIAKNSVTVAERTEGLDSNTVNEVKESAAEFDQCKSIHEAAELEQKLDNAFDQLVQEFEKTSLNDKDRNYVNGFKADYQAANHRIKNDPYHEMRDTVEDKTSGILAKFLRMVTFSQCDYYRIGGK